MSITVETTFTTNDGQLFTDRSQAIKHERQLQFQSWFEQNNIFGVDQAEFRTWMIENKAFILKFLGA